MKMWVLEVIKSETKGMGVDLDMDGEESSEIEVGFNGCNEKDEFQSKEIGGIGRWAMSSAIELVKK
jgi:hypothetical protein